MLKYEHQYPDKIIAGVDEAGRGPLAGPVFAASVIIDKTNIIEGIKDSKKLSPIARERLYEQITKHYIWSVHQISHDEIDKINIYEATKKACIMSISQLEVTPDIVLIDGNMKFQDERFISIIKGDNLSLSIAAASIIAKVTRDRLMLEYAKEFPEYKWHKNFGYATSEHIEAINKYGMSPYHRKSFRVRGIVI